VVRQGTGTDKDAKGEKEVTGGPVLRRGVSGSAVFEFDIDDFPTETGGALIPSRLESFHRQYLT